MKQLALLTTGGTIAMSAQGSGGARLALGADDIVAAAPFLGEVARIAHTDVLSIPSASFGVPELAKIVDAVQAARDADGIVVTHGTDTLEETAFALELTVTHPIPVVLTGAMRRFDQPGADGAGNLEGAGLAALDPQSRGKGVLVVMDDEIHWAPLVRKVHAFRTHAFSSAPFGPIGWVSERRVRYALRPDLSYPKLELGDREGVVPILEVGPGLEPSVVNALAEVADALVVSLPGAGHVAARAVGALEQAASRIPVVFATRTGGGQTLASSYGFPGSETDLLARGLIAAGALDAKKVRIMLLILLSRRVEKGEIEAAIRALP